MLSKEEIAKREKARLKRMAAREKKKAEKLVTAKAEWERKIKFGLYTEYDLIQVIDDPVEFSETVDNALKLGFHLIGGASVAAAVTAHHTQLVYCQAVAK